MQELLHLRQFAYQDKFKLSFNNLLIFTGDFINTSDKELFGKSLYIPATDKHPALTFKITAVPWPGTTDLRSIGIHFNSAEERELIAGYDFIGDIFYVDL